MYGLFQEGALSAREQLRAELDLTRRSIAALQLSTTAKTYAIRLRVAEVQTAEMLSDLFGQPPVEESAPIPPPPILAATPPNLSAGPEPIASTESPHPVQGTTSAWSALAGIFWYRRSLAFRVAAGLVLCLVAAVLIVVPVAIMALFPNHLTEIAVAYALIAFVWWLWRRNQPGIQQSG